MIICNYTGENYKDCLDVTLPSWKADKILIYSDTDKFGIKMFEPSKDFNESCRRRISVIKRTIKENPGEDIVYLDTDVYMRSSPIAVFQKEFDVAVTRMVLRRSRFKREVNSGVSFWRGNERAEAFCDEWADLEKYRLKESDVFPEQKALNELAFAGYDGLLGIDVINFSENLYNFERDSDREFAKDFQKYNPRLVHLKQKRWKDEKSLRLIQS